MLRVVIIILVVISSIGIVAPSYCQEEQQLDQQQRKIETIEGNISNLDWAGSKIAIKGLNPADNTYRELVVTVPDDAIITKGTESIGLAELEMDDAVTVRYYEDSQGSAIMVSLQDASP